MKSSKISELTERYVDMRKKGKHNPWFYKHINELSTEDQEKVWQEVENKGWERPKSRKRKARNKNKRTVKHNQSNNRVYWTDQEWDNLANIVWKMRRNDPTPPLVILANRAMYQFPEDRRRNLTKQNIGPLIERLNKKEEEVKRALNNEQAYRDKLKSLENAPTKEDIINNLTDEEIIHHFKDRVLYNMSPQERLEDLPTPVILESMGLGELAGYVVSQFIQNYQTHSNMNNELLFEVLGQFSKTQNTSQKHSIPVPSSTPPNTRLYPKSKIKVAIFGALDKQHSNIKQSVQSSPHLRDKVDIKFVDKNRTANLPTGQDIYVVWSRYCSHAIEEQLIANTKNENSKIIRHFGGINRMIEAIEKEVSALKVG